MPSVILKIPNTGLHFSNGHTPILRNPRLRGLKCLRCGELYPLTLVHSGCAKCASQGVHASLRASYDKQPDMSQYMPYAQVVSLGQGNTPLIASPALAQTIDVAQLQIKDESSNPTGSHKDRMSAIGITQALDFGAHTIVLASSGNAALSAARYAQAVGLGCQVATFGDMPIAYAQQMVRYGAQRLLLQTMRRAGLL